MPDATGEGRPLSEEIAVAGLWDGPLRTEAKMSVGRYGSLPAAFLERVQHPRGCSGEQSGSSCALPFCSFSESFVSLIRGFNVTVLG